MQNRARKVEKLLRENRKFIRMFEDRLSAPGLDKRVGAVLKKTVGICKKIEVIVQQPRPDITLLSKLLKQARELRESIDNLGRLDGDLT